MRFNVGDIVRIAKSSQYYGDDREWNPKDTDGAIRYIDEDDGAVVHWNNGERCWYEENDLKLRRKAVST